MRIHLSRRFPSPLSLPALLWQGIFFGVPVLLALALAFQLWSVTGRPVEPGLGAFQAMLVQPATRAAIGNSLLMSLTVASLAALIAIPVARGIASIRAPGLRLAALLVMALPFFTSSLLRMFGWIGWLNSRGLLAGLLEPVGIRVDGLLNSGIGTAVGLLSLLVPLCTMLLVLAYRYLDPTLVAAARNLGAGPLRCFRTVEFPFLLPAVIAAWQFAFLTAMGDIVAGSILGGNRTYYLSASILDQMKNDAWSLAAAQAMALLTIAVLFMLVAFALIRRSRIFALMAEGGR